MRFRPCVAFLFGLTLAGLWFYLCRAASAVLHLPCCGALHVCRKPGDKCEAGCVRGRGSMRKGQGRKALWHMGRR